MLGIVNIQKKPINYANPIKQTKLIKGSLVNNKKQIRMFFTTISLLFLLCKIKNIPSQTVHYANKLFEKNDYFPVVYV